MQSSIEYLSAEVVDQIAAGEVVERPSHMVKELIENSLDAGATFVRLDFSEGGRQVRIEDDGHGMTADDLGKALDRHATSKIKATDDLWRLKSFGFRGEALASIASVSDLTLTSRTKKNKQAARIQSTFGKRSSVESVGGSIGTQIEIRNLFENVPARLKFLKSASAEATQIKTAVKAMALAHPEVEFSISQEGVLEQIYPRAKSALERAGQILQSEDLFEAAGERNGIQVSIHYGPPSVTAKSSKQIWVFVQNRWVQDKTIQAALMDGFRSLLMHGEYPIAVVRVQTNPEFVDVNIHPTKSQVKFVDSSEVFRAVQQTLRNSIEKTPWIQKKEFTSFMQPENLSFQDHSLTTTQFQQKTSLNTMYNPAKPTMDSVLRDQPMKTALTVAAQLREQAQNQTSSTSIPAAGVQTAANTSYWSRLQVLGQANLTYILTQSATELVLVDQHAAHERVMFEKLMKKWRGGEIEIQETLFPLTLDFSADQVEALVRETEALKKLGITIEQMGPQTVGVLSAPLGIKDKSLVEMMQKLANELVDVGGSFSHEKMVIDVCATLACHSAIRAGQALSEDEMKALLNNMDEFPLSSFCPHGRPVSVHYSFQFLEKEFGRTLG